MKATIFDIQRASFVDGPGIRTTVFFKGCNLKCKWCHNPESQSAKPQIMFYKNKCIGCGKCVEACPTKMKECVLCGKCADVCLHDARQLCGKEMTAEEVLKTILKDKNFYETSDGGVTFSGGECMLQIDFLYEILKLCKNGGIHTAVDTAGNVKWEYFEKIIPYTDLFLYDVKCFSEQKHVEGTGVSNKLILENLTRLSKEFKGDIIVRIPVMDGYNTDELPEIASFLKNLGITEVELLPYHKMGEHKYDALGMECVSFSAPAKEDMEKYKALFN